MYDFFIFKSVRCLRETKGIVSVDMLLNKMATEVYRPPPLTRVIEASQTRVPLRAADTLPLHIAPLETDRDDSQPSGSGE